MCGRFTQKFDRPQVTEEFYLSGIFNPLEDNYNLAPSQPAAIVLRQGTNNVMDSYRFGLLPHFAKDEKSHMLINARAETVAEKSSFKHALRYRRCLVPTGGFYEWVTGPGGKQPYYISLKDEDIFSLAGIYERTELPDGRVIYSFAIITCEPNELMATIHNRMPVIISAEDRNRWLDTELTDPGQIQDLLKPYPSDKMQAWPVSKEVNSPRNNEAHLTQPQKIDDANFPTAQGQTISESGGLTDQQGQQGQQGAGKKGSGQMDLF